VSAYKPFLFILFVIIFFVVLYKVSHSPENDADKYYKQYFDRIATVKVIPIDKYIKGYTIRYTHYKTGFTLIGYKALSGSIYTFNFQDSISRKYFSLKLFDKNYQSTHSIDEEILNKEINAYVNQYDLEKSNYGTKQNPIPVFNFKGVKEPIRISSQDPGSVNGYETLEPTRAEYEHNVLTYLRYVMPQKEFKERFEGKK
jgi:hypothetical protein